MSEQQKVDVTERASLGEQFPLRFVQLGFRLMQVVDAAGREQYRYILPPVCEVPEGPFLIGSDPHHDPNAQDDEAPQHTVSLERFYIGAYPLTVAEYACFVQATQRVQPAGWSNHPTQRQHPDHPVVCVLGTDVLAYTRWLADMSGERWRLPSEAEWEKATRGADGRIYPWGDQWDPTRANTRSSKPPTTLGSHRVTPVGSYPSGASPYGAQDMAGNVLEWTSTTVKSYPYQAGDGREDLSQQHAFKVLRGGSYHHGLGIARAARRYPASPGFTYYYVGARLVGEGMAGSPPREYDLGIGSA